MSSRFKYYFFIVKMRSILIEKKKYDIYSKTGILDTFVQLYLSNNSSLNSEC